MLDCLICTYSDVFPHVDDQVAANPGTKAQAESMTCEETQRRATRTDPLIYELQQERNSLMYQLRQAKLEIKKLQAGKETDRRELEALRTERRQVQDALEGRHVENRDVLDSVFDW